MPWTASSAAARAGKSIGLRSSWTQPAAIERASLLAGREERPGTDTVFARVYRRTVSVASSPDRKALEAAHAALGEDAAVIERAVASGAPVRAVAALASAWEGLADADKAVVRNPVGLDQPGVVMLGNAPATQVDATTCGAAVMTMMLMMGDPFVGLWMATGRILGYYQPTEVAQVTQPRDQLHTPQLRWHALQRAMHIASTRGTFTAAPWPKRFGTPPWGVSQASRFTGVRFKGALLDDMDPADVQAHIVHASASLRDGIPVVLFTCGDSDQGVEATVPRHVVLLTARVEDGFHVYEPSSGAVHHLSDQRLIEGGPRSPALGNWNHVCWMVLPTPRQRG